jgi:hypothetical protein
MATTTTDPFKETISAHLQEVAQNDKLFAETLKKPNKSIDGCIKYIYSEVQKAKRIGWKDDEIFNMAVHYYDEDSIEEIKSVPRPKVNHTTEKPKENPKMEEYKKAINTSLKKREKTSKSIQKKPAKVFIQPTLFD